MMQIVRALAVVAACLLALTGCGKSSKPSRTSTTTSAGGSSTSSASSSTASAPTTTSTLVPASTTTQCPTVGSTAPQHAPASQESALLTAVTAGGARCHDRVAFTFGGSGAAPPNCSAAYRTGPFTQDASGAPVRVAGSAFIAVRCTHAYTYDFETGRTTYAGPTRIEGTGTRHVRELVETGAFEGVLNWVIGLDAPRAFSLGWTGGPSKGLVVTIS